MECENNKPWDMWKGKEDMKSISLDWAEIVSGNHKGGRKTTQKDQRKPIFQENPWTQIQGRKKKTRGYKDIVGLKSIKNQIIKCNTKDQIAEDKKGDLDWGRKKNHEKKKLQTYDDDVDN